MMARRRLTRDARGAALLEFALALPILLTLGGYGIELGNLALTNMRISQIALTLADNASRIGVNNGSAMFQLREGDVNDILQGARLMGAGLKLTTYGRVTISSLENVQRSFWDGTADSAPVQRIHWQRCVGTMKGATGSKTFPSYDSNNGVAADSPSQLATVGTDQTQANAGKVSAGMGSNPTVVAPSAPSGVIFVEVNYQYQPLFGTMFAKKQLIHYVGSFIVRDRRDFAQIYNPTSALGTKPVPSTCDLYPA
jgi:hypothetical protein